MLFVVVSLSIQNVHLVLVFGNPTDVSFFFFFAFYSWLGQLFHRRFINADIDQPISVGLTFSADIWLKEGVMMFSIFKTVKSWVHWQCRLTAAPESAPLCGFAYVCVLTVRVGMRLRCEYSG